MHLRTLKEIGLITALVAFVLIVNIPAISFSMIHFEQPPIYLANQKIHSLFDLFNVYINPQRLYSGSIPFFRPSGHFLIYQLVTPFLGWHNIKAFIIINLIFLGLTGYILIKLYELLFPKFKIGGYIAFGIYIMHPALILSRLMAMQFDFAHVFFSLLSLYCFVLFCQKNINLNHAFLRANLNTAPSIDKIVFRYFNLIAFSILFFAIAITFKEVAIMLGVVMASYFIIAFYGPASIMKMIKHTQFRKILLLLLLVFMILGLYLSMQWPGLMPPSTKQIIKTGPFYLTAIQLSEYLFALWTHPSSTQWGHYNILFPIPVRLLLLVFSFILILSTVLLFLNKELDQRIADYKKSLLFLYFSALAFFILPISWAAAYPWHLNLTLVFIALAMGFSFEYLARHFLNQRSLNLAGSCLALILGLMSISVTQAHLDKKQADTNYYFDIIRNAVLSPPQIKSKLNSDSLIVVEDSKPLKDYLLGDGFYPFEHFSAYKKRQMKYFLKPEYVYNGTLFRWAYLMPELKEELFAFKVTQLDKVPDEMIYNWLQHFDNIFCLGYDENANWHDLTPLFKENLSKEKYRRHLTVTPYQSITGRSALGHVMYSKDIPFPNAHLCQMECDKNKDCKGFTLSEIDFTFTGLDIKTDPYFRCWFRNGISLNSLSDCPWSTLYIKRNA